MKVTGSGERECRINLDCGPGYRCEYGICKQIPQADGDDDIAESEEEIEPEPDPDEIYEEEEEEEAPPCSGDDFDPLCDSLHEDYCQGNTEPGDEYYCFDETHLRFCLQIFDCASPTCGWGIDESSYETCPDVCVVNPIGDDYCGSSADGDFDQSDGDGGSSDTDIEADIEEDEPLHNANDGYPCRNVGDCLTGHVCLDDYDGIGGYCALNTNYCVYHVGIPEGDPADFYEHGFIICDPNTNAYKRCSSGNWRWQEDFDCSRNICDLGDVTPGQICRNSDPLGQGGGCFPPENPNVHPCPGNYSCLDEHNCRDTCEITLPGLPSHCRPEYSCNDSHQCLPE